MTSILKITIATRESRLAMWQALHVQSRLQALGHSVSLLPMTTQGDQILDRSLSKVAGRYQEPAKGVEPLTPALRMRCSAN